MPAKSIAACMMQLLQFMRSTMTEASSEAHHKALQSLSSLYCTSSSSDTAVTSESNSASDSDSSAAFRLPGLALGAAAFGLAFTAFALLAGFPALAEEPLPAIAVLGCLRGDRVSSMASCTAALAVR